MIRDILERLRCFGFAPKTMLDIGAGPGQFAHAFLKAFPSCTPVLIEPNPHYADELARAPGERHAFAASDADGQTALSFAKFGANWGASFDRERSQRLQDDAPTPIPGRKIDTAFAGRKFEFVRIAAQDALLPILAGGEKIIRQAHAVLVELPLAVKGQRGAPVEDVVAKLSAMGFRSAEIAECRAESGSEGRIGQMNLLFERGHRAPSQNFAYTPLHDHAGLLRVLTDERSRNSDFKVIDVGAAANPWSRDVIDATFDMNDCAVAPLHFKGNLNDPRSWDQVLSHVATHGRFAFAICAHTLEDLAYPAIALEMLPRIADAGFVSVPSRYLESLRPEGPYRGFIHHRWILDQDAIGGQLILAPKISLLEHLAVPQEQDWARAPSKFELQMMWRGGISFQPLNGDYLGPNRKNVIDMYAELVNRS
jgi:FkbM family methyltransferase